MAAILIPFKAFVTPCFDFESSSLFEVLIGATSEAFPALYYLDSKPALIAGGSPSSFLLAVNIILLIVANSPRSCSTIAVRTSH